jgi:Bifunctional DNA primase/polymerase, N-terminal
MPPSLAEQSVTLEMEQHIRRLCQQQVSLIPIPRGSKIPGIAWKQYQRELPSTQQIETWFLPRQGFPAPATNYAILTGAFSGLVAVDADSAEAEEWAQANLPPTPWVTVTRNGRHRYYRHPEGVRIGNRVKLKTGDHAIALDLRGDGGYCIGPYSRHQSGFVYQAEGDWTTPKSELPVFEPTWLPAAEQARATSSLVSHRTVAQTTARLTLPDDDVFERAQQYVFAMGPAIEGSGGDAHTYKVAACLVIDWALNDSDALTIMARWNQHCSPPWELEDLERKIASAKATATGIPGRLRNEPRQQPDKLTVSDYQLIVQAEQLQRALEQKPNEADPPAVAPPPVALPDSEPAPWNCKPLILRPMERANYCSKVWLQLTGGDKGYTRLPWQCDLWKCGPCATRKAVSLLMHFSNLLQLENDRTYYMATVPTDPRLQHQIYTAMARAAQDGQDVQYLRATREDTIEGAMLKRSVYLTTWAPVDKLQRRPASTPTVDWQECDNVQAHQMLNSVALRLPGVLRIAISSPGKNAVCRWALPEPEVIKSGRKAVTGSESRLQSAMNAARHKLFHHYVDSGWLPVEFEVGESIPDVTARQLFEQFWVAEARSSKKHGDEEYETPLP